MLACMDAPEVLTAVHVFPQLLMHVHMALTLVLTLRLFASQPGSGFDGCIIYNSMDYINV